MLTPGPELDVRVAKAMGWEYRKFPDAYWWVEPDVGTEECPIFSMKHEHIPAYATDPTLMHELWNWLSAATSFCKLIGGDGEQVRVYFECATGEASDTLIESTTLLSLCAAVLAVSERAKE